MPKSKAASSSKKRPRPGKERAAPAPAPRSAGFPVGISEKHKERYTRVVKEKEIRANTVLNWDVLGRYGFANEFDHFFQDRAWRNLLDLQDVIYRKITLEFIATFETEHNLTMGVHNSVSFLFNGRYFKLSMREFIKRLGIYENEDYVDTEDLARLRFSWYDQMNPSRFWQTVGRDIYQASTSRASDLTNPAHRILHYILARSTSGKIDSEGIVSAFDCLQMWSMIRNQRLNVGLIAVQCLKRQGERGRKGIFVGAWITRLLKNMGVFPVDPPTDSIGSSLVMAEQVLRYWGFGQVPEAGPGPQRVEVPVQERRGFSHLQKDIDELKREQKVQKKLLKKLTTYISSSFQKMGEAMGISMSPCGSSSSEDVVSPSPPSPAADQPLVVVLPSSSTSRPQMKLTPRRR